jgi:undecaprenyl-diphosphatase
MLRLNSLLAVPTMMAVTCYSVLENLRNISTEEGYELILKSNENIQLLIGNVVAFIVAIIAIKFFIEIIKKYGFKPWGWYRIIVGTFVDLLYILKIISIENS